MDLVLKGHGIIGIAQKIKVKPVQIDPPVVIHEKTLHPAGVLCHTENKDVIHNTVVTSMIG